jgi:hypothetical protein
VATRSRPHTRITEYASVLQELNAYNKSILDIAERAALIDAASRPLWEKDFYIPF